MQYRWTGRKPMRLAVNTTERKGRGPAQITGLTLQDAISYGDVFEPTEAQVKSFGDLMEPVGGSLRETVGYDTRTGDDAPSLPLP